MVQRNTGAHPYIFPLLGTFFWNLVFRGFSIEEFELDIKIIKFRSLLEYADPKFRKIS